MKEKTRRKGYCQINEGMEAVYDEKAGALQSLKIKEESVDRWNITRQPPQLPLIITPLISVRLTNIIKVALFIMYL